MSDLIIKDGPFKGKPQQWFTRQEVTALIEQERKDAARYNAFFADGLPVCFRGQEYSTKEELDAAIDAAMAKESAA